MKTLGLFVLLAAAIVIGDRYRMPIDETDIYIEVIWEGVDLRELENNYPILDAEIVAIIENGSFRNYRTMYELEGKTHVSYFNKIQDLLYHLDKKEGQLVAIL